MNLKRIMLLIILLMIVIFSLSIVSAGWFDFLGGDSGPDNYREIIHMNASNSSNFYVGDFHEETPGKTVTYERDDFREIYFGETDKGFATISFNAESDLTKFKITHIESKYNIDAGEKPTINKTQIKDFYTTENLNSILQKALNDEDGWTITQSEIYSNAIDYDNISYYSIENNKISVADSVQAGINPTFAKDISDVENAPPTIKYIVENQDKNVVLDIEIDM